MTSGVHTFTRLYIRPAPEWHPLVVQGMLRRLDIVLNMGVLAVVHHPSKNEAFVVEPDGTYEVRPFFPFTVEATKDVVELIGFTVEREA